MDRWPTWTRPGSGVLLFGESYVKLNQPAEAIPVLEAALVINRTDADALYQLGLAYQASGQPQTALERYHQAVRLVPDFVQVYQGMIESYSALGQPHPVAYARGMEAFCLQDYEAAQPTSSRPPQPCRTLPRRFWAWD